MRIWREDQQRRRVDGVAARTRSGRQARDSASGIRLDSELVVKQLRGEYRVKHPDLQPLHRRAVVLLRAFDYIDLRHVPRKQNAMADRLVNRVLDQEAPAPAK